MLVRTHAESDRRQAPPRLRRWAIAALAVTTVALLIATQNYYVLARAGRPVPWGTLALGELPVWFGWLALAPVVIALTRRFPPSGDHLLRNATLHVAFGLAATFLVIALTTASRLALTPALVPPTMGFWDALRRGFTNSFVVFLPIYAGFVAAILAVGLYADAARDRARRADLETALTRARLDTLRGQLHPHFLFNTLHAVSALMDEDVQGARTMIRKLSDLLRVSLHEGPHTVPLREELDILDRYVALQKIRYGERLKVRYDVSAGARDALVPRLILQPLVENAIRYAIEGRDAAGAIDISAGVVDGTLALSVRDSGPGFGSADTLQGQGVGLSNTEARLRQLYGASHDFVLRNHEGGGAEVRVEIPARGPTAADADVGPGADSYSSEQP